jgi:uncharacterized protein YkwD
MARKAPHLAIALVALLVLGAGSPAADEASASACKRWGDQVPGEDAKGHTRKAVLCFVNRERQSRGLRKLDRNRKLQRAAQRHTDKMASSGCFAHECPGEGDLTDRLENVNYLTSGLSKWIYAENVAWGPGNRGTPKAIVNAWMGSPPHRANILHPSFRDVGVGVEPGTPGSQRTTGGIYTLDFGLAVH